MPHRAEIPPPAIPDPGPSPVEQEPIDPVEQLIHDFTNMVASVISGFALIERRSQEPDIKALAVQGKKAADGGLALARRLKDICG